MAKARGGWVFYSKVHGRKAALAAVQRHRSAGAPVRIKKLGGDRYDIFSKYTAQGNPPSLPMNKWIRGAGLRLRRSGGRLVVDVRRIVRRVAGPKRKRKS